MTRKYSDMNQHDALYKIARTYPGGLEALAGRMGVSVNVLRNKLAPGIESHYPSFEELSMIVELCHEAGVKDAHLPLHALLSRHGMAAFVIPEPSQVSEDDLSQTVCRVMSRVGDVPISGLSHDPANHEPTREHRKGLAVHDPAQAEVHAAEHSEQAEQAVDDARQPDTGCGKGVLSRTGSDSEQK